MLNLEERLSQLPDKPGVYLMKDRSNEIIYVGKAISLKNRVRQYFQSGKNKDKKVRSMVSHIEDFEYIIVDNEIEALILESNLIKMHEPKYNILLRDDKQYPYIKVNIQERYPRVMKTRTMKKDGARYFGPYPSVTAVNDALEIIRNNYPIRNCSRNLEAGRSYERPCLNYFIGRCLGPCIGNVKDEDYDELIQEIIGFLDGKDTRLLKNMEEKMKEAARDLRFEDAAKYRDKLVSINYLAENQKIISTSKQLDQDFIAMARGIDEVCVQVFFVRNGKIIGREHFIINNTFKDDNREIINSFIKQFYSGTAFVPKEILIEEDIEEMEVIEEWLSEVRGARVRIGIPKIGEKKKLLNMVKKNARDMINKYGDRFLRKYRKNLEAVDEIKDLLGLDGDINRLEAFDISNIAGTNSVGSMVVFEDGDFKKSDYRRFKIKTVTGPDDYASMEEVLTRRFKRGVEEKRNLEARNLKLQGFSAFPDLIMMDGGKGQVNIALKVLYDLGISIPVCGLIKDDFHTTRGIIYNNEEYTLKENSLGYRLIYSIQEEAHRFAISYHRSLRSKDMFVSELDGIRDIGPKRKKELLRYFKSLDKIKKASIEELEKVPSMTRRSAESLFNHFRDKSH